MRLAYLASAAFLLVFGAAFAIATEGELNIVRGSSYPVEKLGYNASPSEYSLVVNAYAKSSLNRTQQYNMSALECYIGKLCEKDGNSSGIRCRDGGAVRLDEGKRKELFFETETIGSWMQYVIYGNDEMEGSSSSVFSQQTIKTNRTTYEGLGGVRVFQAEYRISPETWQTIKENGLLGCAVEIRNRRDPGKMLPLTLCNPPFGNDVFASGNAIFSCTDNGTRLVALENCEWGANYSLEMPSCNAAPETDNGTEKNATNATLKIQRPKSNATACSSDNDCADGEICAAKAGLCVRKSTCTLLFEEKKERKGGGGIIDSIAGFFGDIADAAFSRKLDIALVGDEYATDYEFRQDVEKIVDWNGTQNGLLSVEPFKSNRGKIRIWIAQAEEPIAMGSDGRLDRAPAKKATSRCDWIQYQVVVSKKNFTSYAYVKGDDAYVSLDSSEKWGGRVLAHEFGHSFGKLADEYTKQNGTDMNRYPNCAPDNATAQKWWGGTPGTGYFAGCSYVDKNIRPTEDSIMFHHWLLRYGYGPVNEKQIREKLDEYR